MKYLSDRSKSKNRYLNIVLGFIAFTLFIYYWPTFRAIIYPIVEPVMRGYGSTKSVIDVMPSFIATYLTSHKTLAEANRNLETNVERLENQLAEREAFIREQLLIQGPGSAHSAGAVVVLYPIAEDVTKLYSTLLLSKGYKDSIQKGSIVYVRGMQPVCEIIEVYDKTSLCELFSKGNRVTEAVTSSSTITLSLVGEGGGNFTASIPKGMAVEVGENVYLRSDPTYTLGTVVTVKEDEQATGAKIYVKGAYNPVTSSVFYISTK